MKQANQIPFRTHFDPKDQPIEKVDSKPCETFISGQAIRLSELVQRFLRGQRLNVHMTTPNEFYATDEEAAMHHERFEDCPPAGLDDIVDVMNYQDELSQRKQDLKDRVAKKRAEQLAKEKEGEEAKRKQAPPTE